MNHLKINLEQAAKFSVRAENKLAAESALRMIESGSLRTRGEVKSYIERAIEKARQDRSACIDCHRSMFCVDEHRGCK